jgi:N-acyl homoserine lactone hydrolase
MSRPRVHTLLQGNWLDSNQGALVFCAVVLVEGEDHEGHPRRIVVDPGSSGREGALRAALGRHHLTGSDIDAVVLSHAHWDHMQNLDMFNRATFHLHPAELAYTTSPHDNDSATPRWARAVLDRYDLSPVVDLTELLPGVRIIDVRGHSAGTIAVVADTSEGVAVITGDAIQSAEVATSRRNSLVFWDDALATRAIDRINQTADIIYPGHDRPFRLSAAGAVSYTEGIELVISGPAREVGALTLQSRDWPEPEIHRADLT